MSAGRVCILGSINTDLVVRAPVLPAAGQTLMGGPFGSAPGGKGANQAVAAARLGASASLIGAVGDDDHGRESVGVLGGAGVDTSGVKVRAGGQTGVAIITVAETGPGGRGDNTIVVVPGANSTITPADVDAARGAIAGADVLLAQLEVPIDAVARAAELARDAGVTVMLNAAPARRLPADLVPLIDVLIVNEVEAAEVGSPGAFAPARPAGAEAAAPPHPALDGLRALAIPTVIVTLGARGAAYEMGRDAGLVDPFPVDSVDAVGAGDAFCGALAARWADQQAGGGLTGRVALVDALCWACAAGALATTRHGAIPSLPLRAEVVALLRRAAGG